MPRRVAMAGSLHVARILALSALAVLPCSALAANAPPGASVTITSAYAPGFRTMVTDSVRAFTQTAVARPAYLAPFADPKFGTTITRVVPNTGSTFSTAPWPGVWGPDARQHYTKDQPWNSDQSLVSMDNEDGSPTRVYLDAETYQPRYKACWEHRHGDDRWHPNPALANVRISMGSDELAWIDVVNCKRLRTWKLPFWPRGIGASEGNPSDDGRFVALHDATRVFVVDMDPRAPYAPYPAVRMGPIFNMGGCGLATCEVDWASISPSGKYVVIKYHGEHMRVLDVNPATLALTPRAMPATAPRCAGTADQGYVYDLGHLDMARNPFDSNEDVMVGQEHCVDWGLPGSRVGNVAMVRLRDGAVTSLTGSRKEEAYAHHVSCRNLQRPGWAYVSFFEAPGKRFSGELVAVKMDGSKSVQRFAHIHTDFSDCYRCEAHPVPSPDGRRVMWSSNWSVNCTTCGDKTDVKAYVADARALAGNSSAQAPYMTMIDASGSSDADGRIVSYTYDFGDGNVSPPMAESKMAHTYANGRWPVAVTLTDNLGAKTTWRGDVIVGESGNQTPVARLSAQPANGSAPLQVAFDGTGSYDPDGLLLNYRFEFGDGGVSTSSVPVATHTFGIGTWNARLIVSDAGGAADTSEIQIGALSGTMPDSLGSNLVTNPSFEIDLAGWAGYNSAVLSRVAGGLSSNYCAQLKGPLTYGTFGINDSPNWVGSTVAGKKYRVSAAARSTGVAGRVRIQVREWKNGVQQGSTVFSQYVRLNDVWQTLTMDVLAFTSGGALDIQVVDEPALGGELMYIDDISVRMVGSKTVQNVATPDGTPDEVVFGRPTLWPNPMLRRARISFATSREGPLEIDVFDLSGRRMRTLMRAPSLPPGRHEFEFNGRDDNDARIVPGVYFYRVRSANGETDGRFVIAR